MSVYSRFMLESSTGRDDIVLEDVDVDKLMNESSIEEAYETDSYEAAMRCVSENTANYNNIMQACAISEFCYFEENGTEMVYTEGTLSDWKDSAIAFFRKVWDKIQSIFKKVLMQFASWSKNDKDFLNKYKKQLNSKANNGFGDVEVKMYDYVFYGKGAEEVKKLIDDAEKAHAFANISGLTEVNVADKFLNKIGKTVDNAGATPEDWAETVKKVREDQDSITDKLDEYRGALAGKKDTKIDSKEFAKEVTEYFQGDESTKDDVKLGNALDKAMKFLLASDKMKSEINKCLTTNKRSIDQAIKTVNTIYKSLDKNTTKDHNDSTKIAGAKHSLAGMFIGAMKQEKNILTQFNGLALNALKACSRQSKAICVKAATYIDKDKDYKTPYQSESTMTLLNSIEML